WDWDGATWTHHTVTGPSARFGHAMATLNGTAVLFGGQICLSACNTNHAVYNAYGDTWEWDGAAWTQRNVSGPQARAYHGMATLNNKVVLFGGQTATQTFFGDTWEWDGSAWSQRIVTGPTARSAHGMAAESTGKIVLVGGTSTKGGFNSL